MTVDLAAAKAEIASLFVPGHPGREAVLALPDRMDERQFDATFPIVLRLLRLKGTTHGDPSA